MTIQQRLDTLPLSRFHYQLVILGGLGWLFDAMDSILMALVLPALPPYWNLGNPARAALLMSSMLGMLVGAAGAGSLADRIGRQRLFQWTLLLFSLATGLCALAQGFWSLLWLRFLVGLGLGGELPVASSLVVEFSPSAHRGRLVVLLESFWSLGALAAAATALFIPRLGWRFAFALGALPALYVLILRRSMPESPRFLLARGRHKEALEVLRRVEARSGQPPAVVSASPEPAAARVGLADLLSPGLRRRTLLLWGLWFGMVFTYYGIFTWLPTLLAAAGHTLVKTYQYTLWITLAQIPGYFAAAAVVDWLGRRRTLILFLIPCALATLGYASASSPASIVLFGSMISFFNLGAWGVVYTITPELYPTRVRAGGAGAASALGRVGGIVAPYAVSSLLDWGGPQGLVFGMFAGVLILTTLVATRCEETRGRSLEEISH